MNLARNAHPPAELTAGSVATDSSSSPALQELADALWDARHTREPVPQPSATTYPGLTLAEAYAVQRLNVARRLAAGEQRVGHKVGLTSLAMQWALGVSEPDFGVITDAMVIPDGGTVNPGSLLAPRLEAEFAFRLGAGLSTAPTVAELRDAIGDVAVAIEVIDSRVRDWKIALVDTVADNASSAGVAVGEWRPASPQLLERLTTRSLALTRDGEEVSTGIGSAVLGDPVVALHWLASAIGRFGEAFRPGDIVLSGAVTAAVPLTAGSRWEAFAEGFEPVAIDSKQTEE